MPVARLGVRHPHRQVLVRPGPAAGAAISGQREARHRAGRGPACGRDLPGPGREQLRRRRGVTATTTLIPRSTEQEVAGVQARELYVLQRTFVEFCNSAVTAG